MTAKKDDPLAQGVPAAAAGLDLPKEEKIELVRGAFTGDMKAWRRLRALLPPGWEKDFSDPASQAVGNMLYGVFRDEKNHYANGAFLQMVANLRAEIAGENPTPLEKLLAEHIAVCWLARYMAEMQAGAALATDGMSPQRHAVYEHRLHKASQRYSRAIETLAQVRRLQALTPLRAPIAIPVPDRAPARPKAAKAG